MADINYDINYEDERFSQVEADKQAALTDIENTYGDMIENSDQYYNAQINASKEWADTQTELQNAQTNLTISQIEQQKDQATKDYKKEQSGAYVDWKKESNKYGANAEQMAAAGLSNTGYSESSQVAMYNTYQNRVVSAREDYNNAIQNYNNGINEAKLQNSSTLAQIAYESLQAQLQLSLQGFQYKNQLLAEQAAQKTAVDNTYYGRYQDVLNQMNAENSLAEEIRQYNASLEETKRQFDEELAYKKLLAEMEDEEETVILNGDEENGTDNSGENITGSNTDSSGGNDAEKDGGTAPITKPNLPYVAVTADGDIDLTTAKVGLMSGKNIVKAEENIGLEIAPVTPTNTETTPVVEETKQSTSETFSVPEGKMITLPNNRGIVATTIDHMSNNSSNNSSSNNSSDKNGNSVVVDNSKGKVLSTEYYHGYYNSDGVEYGVFSNGYQPKGISGHGKVRKTGDTITFETKTLSGETRTVTQNIWKTKDGKLWYWDGSKNKYIQFEK